MKRYLLLLIIIPLVVSCGAGGGGGGNTTGSGDKDTANSINPACDSNSSSAKIKIKEDGLYRVTSLDLYNACVDLLEIPHTTLKMTNQGEEIAIDVVDSNNNGILDDGDYIEFYGKAIQRGDSRFKYTETNVYWLSAEGGAGKRMELLSSDSQAAPGQSSFLKTLHREEDTWYEQKNYPEISAPWDAREHWFWGEVFYTPGIAGDASEYYIRNYSFSAPYPYIDNDKAMSALLKVRLQSVNGTHHIRGYINDQLVVDHSDLTWDGQETLEVEFSYPASYLNNGPNVFRLESVGDTPAGIFEIFYLDWFEVSYYRLYQAEHNRLEFTGEGQIGLTNLTSNDISVYDISDHFSVKKITGVQVEGAPSGYKAMFSLPENPAGRYFAVAGTRGAPDAIEAYTPRDIKSEGADYIIITHEDFYEAITPLAVYRSDQNYKVLTVKVEDIYNEFGYGIVTPKAIKDFLVFAYNNWAAKPVHVLLVGDATVDYKDISGYGKDYDVKSYVPAYLYNYPALGEVPSDNWFVDINDDVLPEMHIGRIPAKSSAEVSAVVAKIISHEESSLKSTHVMLIADYDPISGTLFETLSESIADVIPVDYTVSKLYQRDYFTGGDFRGGIISGINSGSLIVNYTGHGSVVDWTKEDIFSSEDMAYLTNSIYPFVVALNCLNGYFVMPDDGVAQTGLIQSPSIAEAFLLAQDKGAVAVFAASAIGYPSEHDPLAQELYGILFSQDITLGEAVTKAKEAAYIKGEIMEDVVQTFIFFGDPAARLR